MDIPMHRLLTLLLTALLTSTAGQGIAQSGVTVSLQERAQFWRSLGRADLARQALQKSLRTTPDDPQSLALLAFVSLDLDERLQAEELFRQLQQRHPEAPYTSTLGQMLEITGDKRKQLGQARLMASAGRREEALRLYQELFAGSPHPSPLALEYWQLLARESAYQEEALNGLQILTRIYPGNLRYRMALARHLARHTPPPLQSIETFIELSQHSQLQREAQSAWRNAVLALDETPASLPALRRYLQQDPKDSVVAEQIHTIETEAIAKRKRDSDPVHIGLQHGLALMDEGDLAAAEPLLVAAARKWPRQADIAGSMGRLRLKQARYQQAISWFRKALAIDDAGKWRSLLQAATYWGLIKRAKSAQDNEQLQQAEKLLREALRLDPQEAYGASLLAQLRSLLGDNDEAERLYRRALAIAPQNSTALRGLANLYAKNDRLDAAFALLDSRKLPLGDSWATLQASLLHQRADQQHHGGDTGMAIATLRRAINLEPDNPWLRFDLARLLLGEQEEQQAIELFEQGLELAPQDPQMRYAYALLLSRLDRDTEALQQLSALPEARLSKSMRQYRNRLKQRHQLQQARDLAKQKQQQQAEQILRQLQEQRKNDPDALLTIAETWIAIDAPQPARLLLLQLGENTDLRAEQQHKHRQLELAAALRHADALAATGKPRQALELLTETRQRLGAEPQLLRRMARLHGRSGDYDTALSHYKALAGIELVLPGSQNEDAQWLRWSQINADDKLRDEVADLLQNQSPKILAGLHLKSRDASDGLSSLESYEAPLEIQWPLRGGRLFAHISPVRLDAGQLDLGKERTRQLQGTGALCLRDCITTSLSQIERGTSFAIGYRGAGWRADLGSSPVGFPASQL
ncbi:MAG TPA: tetratricopeptide repeat protein, partial [Thermodesulfobacteriaceae bacterium]|nr:tetratricopeptide repeat protein [Thermodesulfobacteriaceae bacterium]